MGGKARDKIEIHDRAASNYQVVVTERSSLTRGGNVVDGVGRTIHLRDFGRQPLRAADHLAFRQYNVQGGISRPTVSASSGVKTKWFSLDKTTISVDAATRPSSRCASVTPAKPPPTITTRFAEENDRWTSFLEWRLESAFVDSKAPDF